jgi:hypothetical protein
MSARSDHGKGSLDRRMVRREPDEPFLTNDLQ